MKNKNKKIFIIGLIVLIGICVVGYLYISNIIEVKNIRIEKYENKDYYIIEDDYKGEYDLQIFSLNKYIDDFSFNQNDFEKKKVMNYNEYESYCSKWGINKVYSDKRYGNKHDLMVEAKGILGLSEISIVYKEKFDSRQVEKFINLLDASRKQSSS